MLQLQAPSCCCKLVSTRTYTTHVLPVAFYCAGMKMVEEEDEEQAPKPRRVSEGMQAGRLRRLQPVLQGDSTHAHPASTSLAAAGASTVCHCSCQQCLGYSTIVVTHCCSSCWH